MTNQLSEVREESAKTIASIVQAQSATLYMQGLKPEKFMAVCQEALVSVQNLQLADKKQLGKALLTCVRMGLVPNGREAALFINSNNGTVTFWAMVDGWCKIAHRTIGVTIKSGHILEGDKFELINSDEGDKFTHTKGLSKDKSEVIGAYACFKREGYDNFIHVWDKNDIETAERASKMANKEDSPWKKWRGRMAEKGVVKSGIVKAMRMFPTLDEEGEEYLAKVVSDDTQEDLAGKATVIIDQEEEDIEVVDQSPGLTEVEPEPEPEPETPSQKAENMAVEEKVETKPKRTMIADTVKTKSFEDVPW